MDAVNSLIPFGPIFQKTYTEQIMFFLVSLDILDKTMCDFFMCVFFLLAHSYLLKKFLTASIQLILCGLGLQPFKMAFHSKWESKEIHFDQDWDPDLCHENQEKFSLSMENHFESCRIRSVISTIHSAK